MDDMRRAETAAAATPTHLLLLPVLILLLPELNVYRGCRLTFAIALPSLEGTEGYRLQVEILDKPTVQKETSKLSRTIGRNKAKMFLNRPSLKESQYSSTTSAAGCARRCDVEPRCDDDYATH